MKLNFGDLSDLVIDLIHYILKQCMQIMHWFLIQYYSHYYFEMRWMLIFFLRAWQEMFLLPAETFGQFSLLECLPVYLSHWCFLSLLKEKKWQVFIKTEILFYTSTCDVNACDTLKLPWSWDWLLGYRWWQRATSVKL